MYLKGIYESPDSKEVENQNALKNFRNYVVPYLRSVNYCVIQENLLVKCKVMFCLHLLPLATGSTHVMWNLSGWCFSELIGRQAKLQHLGCSFSVFTGSREGSVVL